MRLLFFICISCFTYQVNAQNSLDDLLKHSTSHEVPFISVQELAMPKTNAVILDAREQEEYNVSHLKDAIFVGYNHCKMDSLRNILTNKNQKIVVYCSLGIRSETIAKKLQKEGYTNVYNLYGGIFQWKNEDFPVFDSQEEETENVHVFSKTWSKWLLKGNKVYELNLDKI